MANITLVDDDENIVVSVSLALESHGHKVTSYYDGATGLAALQADPPDLVILDVKMPRMDGMEVLRRLRHQSSGDNISAKRPDALPVSTEAPARDRTAGPGQQV